jgi:hypothetical protein
MADADGSAGATRLDDDTLDYLRLAVAREYELSEAQGRRLRGTTVTALKDDARAMRRELQLPDLDGRDRDEHGRYRSKPVDMNAAIRQAAGR